MKEHKGPRLAFRAPGWQLLINEVRESAILDGWAATHKDTMSALFNASDPEMQSVWGWLGKLSRSRPHADHFLLAALQATQYGQIREAVSLAKKTDGAAFDVSRSDLFCAIAVSRKAGAQSDYLRAFLVLLRDLGFPMGQRGTQAAVLKTAAVVLSDAGLSPAMVSAAWRSIAPMLGEAAPSDA
ncbi:hypothetical protein PQR37_10835 [Paraburkholderia nemoris]|uniref:hypothetical protein n=1 Tax=Paraburkholderia nemoris TaxID=2793076 RepID=UPI0038B98FA4